MRTDPVIKIKRKEWPAFSRFFALAVNQFYPVHEGKKMREVFMNSFALYNSAVLSFLGILTSISCVEVPR